VRQPERSGILCSTSRLSSDPSISRSGKVMLRRTQAEILTNLLPPRRDYVIYCCLTARQSTAYNGTADEIIR
jgi:SNF2 family DNA or RNA helicase